MPPGDRQVARSDETTDWWQPKSRHRIWKDAFCSGCAVSEVRAAPPGGHGLNAEVQLRPPGWESPA